MADFFAISKAYRDQVANPDAGRATTGQDQLERIRSDQLAALKYKKQQGAQFLNNAVTNAIALADAKVGRPASVPKVASDYAANRALGQKLAAERGWTGSLWDAYNRLVMKESGWNNQAQNPTSTAYGIGQFLDSTWKGYGAKTSDPATQIRYMLDYIAGRYGDPQKALQFHLANNWY